MITISHEVPVVLLNESVTFNDYDYSLVHVLDSNEEYYNFYKSQAKNREQILDNSAYELGDSFDVKKFVKYVEDIKPSHYIIPDKIGDYEATVLYTENFIKEYADLLGKSIGVIQASNIGEFMDCYSFMKDKCDKIAVPFHSPSYQTLFPELDKWAAMSLGRPKMLEMVYEKFHTTVPVHLLGCSLPQEFHFYKNKSYLGVESIDTSNPVLLALEEKQYKENEGMIWLDDKPKGMVNYNLELNDDQKNRIIENIKTFRIKIKG